MERKSLRLVTIWCYSFRGRRTGATSATPNQQHSYLTLQGLEGTDGFLLRHLPTRFSASLLSFHVCVCRESRLYALLCVCVAEFMNELISPAAGLALPAPERYHGPREGDSFLTNNSFCTQVHVQLHPLIPRP